LFPLHQFALTYFSLGQTRRLAPLPMPCMALTPPLVPLLMPRTTLLTSPMPCAALSTRVAHYADTSLVYHRRKWATPLAPTDLAPSTSAARIVDPAHIYCCRKLTTSSAPNTSPAGNEPRCTTQLSSVVTQTRPPDGDSPRSRCSLPIDLLIMVVDESRLEGG
jgi:hypothetical protein